MLPLLLLHMSSDLPQLPRALGRLPSCPFTVHTTWPQLIDTYPALDTLLRVVLPGDTAQYFRTYATMSVTSGTSRAALVRFLRESCVEVVGETPAGVLFVHFEDPGPGAGDFRRRLGTLRADPRIATVTPILFSPQESALFGR